MHYSMFDLPEADKCLLASGELDVRCSTFISFSFDLTGRPRSGGSSYETSPFKPEIGHLIRPRRRPRARPRNRKQFKSIEDDDEATDELN